MSSEDQDKPTWLMHKADSWTQEITFVFCVLWEREKEDCGVCSKTQWLHMVLRKKAERAGVDMAKSMEPTMPKTNYKNKNKKKGQGNEESFKEKCFGQSQAFYYNDLLGPFFVLARSTKLCFVSSLFSLNLCVRVFPIILSHYSPHNAIIYVTHIKT